MPVIIANKMFGLLLEGTSVVYLNDATASIINRIYHFIYHLFIRHIPEGEIIMYVFLRQTANHIKY